MQQNHPSLRRRFVNPSPLLTNLTIAPLSAL
jgi:hypothetical protein